jgi:hypothetical protein
MIAVAPEAAPRLGSASFDVLTVVVLAGARNDNGEITWGNYQILACIG